MRRPLVLMAASVMDRRRCIASKSRLNNLPPLWLERLSQLFNDVSVLEGRSASVCVCVCVGEEHEHTPTDRPDGTECTHAHTCTHWRRDQRGDMHGHATNERRPSSAEQLRRLRGKETPTQPLSKQL